jgi:hypothetical protein
MYHTGHAFLLLHPATLLIATERHPTDSNADLLLESALSRRGCGGGEAEEPLTERAEGKGCKGKAERGDIEGERRRGRGKGGEGKEEIAGRDDAGGTKGTLRRRCEERREGVAEEAVEGNLGGCRDARMEGKG